MKKRQSIFELLVLAFITMSIVASVFPLFGNDRSHENAILILPVLAMALTCGGAIVSSGLLAILPFMIAINAIAMMLWTGYALSNNIDIMCRTDVAKVVMAVSIVSIIVNALYDRKFYNQQSFGYALRNVMSFFIYFISIFVILLSPCRLYDVWYFVSSIACVVMLSALGKRALPA